MKVWGITDTGLVRQENQDAYASFGIDSYVVGVVCDGMGGTQGGQIASAIAVECFRRSITQSLKANMTTEQIEEVMTQAVSLGNSVVYARAKTEDALKKMGTTLVGTVCSAECAIVCNIGDSRCYHITGDGISQITHDHSVVEDMVEHGELTPAQARRHPNRNLITRAIGPDEQIRLDTFTVNWQKGDFLLLCSDGLVNTVSEQEMLFEVLHGGKTDECMERLLTVSLSHGAPDNVTALLIENCTEEVTE